MIGNLLKALTTPLVYLLKPFKIFAYRTRSGFLRRLIIETTTIFDFVLNFIHGQNEIMTLHQKVYGGNFIFGRGVMITDHETAAREMPLPSHRTNEFMGISVVSGNEVFVTNAPMIALGQPFRGILRNHLDETQFNEDFYKIDYATVQETCATILEEWVADPKASEITIMRSCATRVFIKMLSDITIPKDVSESVTAAYLRRFVELSLFQRYLPYVSGLLGSEKHIKKDAFYKLQEYGVPNTVIDSTLFAAMFSVGTLFTRCVDDIRRHGIDYQGLDLEKRRNFVIEAVRLYPTVTTTHRVVKKPETVRVAGKDLQLTGGDQIVYAIVCANTDERAFECPHKMDVERPEVEYEKVLSWSDGPHVCPAKELSILVTMNMLDALGTKQPLSEIDYGGALL